MTMSAKSPVECETCKAREPEEPLASDCCGNGCNPCVFDLYEADLVAWRSQCDRCHEGGSQDEHRETSKPLQDARPDALSTDEYTSFQLRDITRISHNTCIYEFTLPVNTRLNLSVGQHIILRSFIDGRAITRQYTPINPPGTANCLQVLIKVYPDGVMSKYVLRWNEGGAVEWRGPYGTFHYQTNQYRRIIMLAAGTGITPMLQVIRQIVADDNEETTVRLVYSSRTYGDILLREVLNDLTAYWNFTVLYALSQEKRGRHVTSYGETYHHGRIHQDLLSAETEAHNSHRTQILICGPKSFEKDMVNFLKRLDFQGDVCKF